MAQPAPVAPLIEPAQGVSQVTGDIYALSCPVPFDVGTVNVYLLLGDPITLIDTGSRIGFDIDDLCALISRTGTEPERIEQLILTHRHMDHFGLAKALQERTGAAVVASRVDGPFMANWGPSILGNREQLATSGVAFGIPEELFRVNDEWVRAVVHAAEAITSDRLVGEGDVVRAGGRDLRVIETPGHTEGLITFMDDAAGFYFANDHVLRHITPNPDVYSYDPDGLRSGLPDYVESLRKVRDLDVSLVLPGHGYEMSDLRGRVDEILFHHDQRAARVEEIVTTVPSSIYQIVGKVWEKLRARDTHLAVREIIGHLVLLERDGRVKHTRDGDVLIFSGAA